jgi:hypothetical protein
MLRDVLKTLFRRTSGPSVRPEGRPQKARPGFVAFLTSIEEPHFLAEGEIFESDQASMRLRVGIPAAQLARRFPVWLVPVDYVQQDPTLARLGTPRALVVGKLPVRFFTEEPRRAFALIDWIEAASAAQRIAVDFSDDLGAAAVIYSQPTLLEFQKRFLGACHATVPTRALRDCLLPYARHGVSVIEDPFESARASEPRLSVGPLLRLAWFGVFAAEQRPFMEAQLAGIAERLVSRPTELTFVTYAAQAAAVEAMATALARINPQFSVRHVPWSLAATQDALERTDMVVIPQEAGSDWGRAKSHNRLVESIRAGRFVVGSAIPSYVELASYAWIGNDLAAGIEWGLANPAEALHRVRQGQDYVAERFAPEQIGALWMRTLGL